MWRNLKSIRWNKRSKKSKIYAIFFHLHKIFRNINYCLEKESINGHLLIETGMWGHDKNKVGFARGHEETWI
jgi:hypothetical protein